jgi:hypothetical protein
MADVFLYLLHLADVLNIDLVGLAEEASTMPEKLSGEAPVQ